VTPSSRWAVPALAAGLVLLSAGAGIPARADTAQPCTSPASVVVHVRGGSSQQVSAAALCDEADVFNTQYSTRAAPGKRRTQSEPFIAQGTSLRALLQGLAPAIDPAAVRFVAVVRGDGTWTTLSASDLGDPSDFSHGLLPVLQVNGDLINYFRPLYPGSRDVNAGDAVTTPAGGQLELDVHTGPLLNVSATVNRDAVRPGQEVRYGASVADPPSSSQPLSYAWTFGDGATATGRRVSHAFSAPGSYDAQVTVTGADDSQECRIRSRRPSAPRRLRNQAAMVTVTAPRPPITRQRPAPRTATGIGAAPGPPGTRRTATQRAFSGVQRGTLVVPPIHGMGQIRELGGEAPLLASQAPLVRGQLVGAGTILSAEQTRAVTDEATAAAASAAGTTSTNIWAGIGAAAGVIALLLLGAMRERRRRNPSQAQVPR